MRRVVADSTEKNDQCFLNSTLVPSETKKIKDVKGSFNSPGWLL